MYCSFGVVMVVTCIVALVFVGSSQVLHRALVWLGSS